MTTTGFLLDEHVPLVIQARLAQLATGLRVYAVGEDDAPPKGTPDSAILAWVEAHDCLLVTNNRATMPVHLTAHLAGGGHVPGIVQLPRRMDVRVILKDLFLIWSAGLEGEFRDQIIYLPL